MTIKRSFSLFVICVSAIFLFGRCASAKTLRSAEKKLLPEKIIQSAEKALLSEKVIQTAHIGISVYDVDAGKFIYDHQGDHYFVPASNIKIPTCYAAMKYLGDSLTSFRYILRGDTITITGAGNPDFLHPDFKQQPAFDFLKRFRHVNVSAHDYNEYLGNGWSWNDYKEYYMAQRSEFPLYGNIVRFKWLSKDDIDVTPRFFKTTTNFFGGAFGDGFALEKTFDENNFIIAGGTEKSAEIPFVPAFPLIVQLLRDTLRTEPGIAIGPLPPHALTFKSRAVDSVLAPMMHRSDNFFAEQMLLMVSEEILGKMNDDAVIDTLLRSDFASLPQKPRWVDGSGLSRYNLFSPQDFVVILSKMQKEFGMDRIKKIFPTGGKGTLGSYYQEEAGQIFAKTGTLSGVVSLSGFLYTKKGKLLLFSVLVNNHNGSASEVRHGVERFIQNLRDLK